MFPLLIACLVLAAEGYFLPPLHPAQPSAIRGQTQGNDFYPEYNKIEENLNYNNRFLYQSPHQQYQQFADSQRFYSQSAAQQAYGPPHLQHLQYQQPEPLTEPVYSDVRGAPSFYVQPHDEETTRQQTLSVSPQYLNLPSQASPNTLQQIPAQQANLRGPGGVPGLQTTAQTTIPVLIRVSDNQALIVPVRAVYALPGFLERLVQRVQGYYSVYNPVENLVVDRPYYVSTGSPLEQQQPVLANSAENAVEPMKADLVQDPGHNSPDSTELASQSLDTRITDLKQEEIKDETTTAAQPEEMKEGTTEASTEEAKDSTDKADNDAEGNDTNEATTSSPSADETPATESSSPTTESVVSSTSSDISSTSEPTSTAKPAEEPSSPEDNSADLESAGYTYYRPAIPFYYPQPK